MENITDVIRRIKDAVDCEKLAKEMFSMDVNAAHKMCCPFHQEKTPSCHCFKKKVHCFGCGADYDAIDFVQAVMNISKFEAIKVLAAYAGINIDLKKSEMPKDTLRFMSNELALIGINDTAALKKLYDTDRKTFWAYLDQCMCYTIETYLSLEDISFDPAVESIIDGNAEIIEKMRVRIEKLKKTDKPERVLIIRG